MKSIKINIQNEENLLETYDKNIVNHKLIEYILTKAYYTNKYEDINIIIHNYCKTNVHIEEKIIEGLKLKYETIIKEQQRKNKIQILLLLLGITFIFLSSLMSEHFIWKEVVLIIGWVPIWEVIDIELFNDSKNRKTKKVIEKLLNSEIKVES